MAGQQTPVDVGGIVRPAGGLDLATALQPHVGRLGERSAAHLLRRAGFGGTPDQVRRYAAMTAGDAVASLLTLPQVSSFTPPQELEDVGGPMSTRRERAREGRDATFALQLWWLNRMLSTPTPLQEKMTLYFHGHFTSRATPVYPWITYNQNALLQRGRRRQHPVQPPKLQRDDRVASLARLFPTHRLALQRVG